jgi:MFS family permease
LTSTQGRVGATPALAGRNQVLAGLLLVILLAAMDAAIVATVVPPIVSDLGGFSLFPWLFSVYLLAQAATVPIYSKLADLYGRKPVLLAGVTIFLTGSALCGISWNMTALIAFRGFQGVGAGAILPTYVQAVHQTTTLVAGFVLAAMSLGWSLSSTFSSRLYLRIGLSIGRRRISHATPRRRRRARRAAPPR